MGKLDPAAAARLKSAEYTELAAGASEQRGAVLLAIARSWLTLANQMDRLHALESAEKQQRVG